MIVSVEHGFVFVKTRKTAGTSIEIALSRYVGRRGDVVTEITEEDERIRRATPGAHPPMGVRVPLRRRLRGAPARWRNHTPAAVAALHVPTWDRSRRGAVVRDPWDVAASTVRWRRHVTGDPDLTLDDVLATGWHPALNWEAITVADEPVVEVIRDDRLVPRPHRPPGRGGDRVTASSPRRPGPAAAARRSSCSRMVVPMATSAATPWALRRAPAPGQAAPVAPPHRRGPPHRRPHRPRGPARRSRGRALRLAASDGGRQPIVRLLTVAEPPPTGRGHASSACPSPAEALLSVAGAP